MTHWFAEGDTPDGPRKISLSGTDLAHQNETQEQGPVVRVGDGPPDTLPAPVLPRDMHVIADFAQTKPMDRVSAWVRLWLLGLMDRQPGWDGVVCATYGDVTHWIEVSAKEAVSCRSSVTLRLCRLMQGAGVLDEDAVAASISRPERLVSDLYTAGLVGDGGAVTGHLVGAELATMRPYWLGRDIVLVTDQPGLYMSALSGQGVPAKAYSPEELLHGGLAVVARARGFHN
ncbi:MAG: 2-dehydro-3-deoxygalactonokinase [Pseudomonadota bacterium]